LVVAVACGGAAAAEPPGVVTLLEGQAALLRGTTRYALAEGVRLQSGDIVELGDKGLALVEFADGCEVSLGPRARLYLAGLVPRGGKAGGGVSDFYLMQGWAKLSSGKKAAPLRITTPVFGLGTSDATAVVSIGDGEGAMFVESGEMRVAEGFVKATPASPVRLRGGEFFTRKVDQRSATAARPAPAFVAAMPKAYMDNLPSRYAKLKDRETNPRATGELAYGDVELWLKAPPEIRRALMQRFVQKANRDAEFRQALVANLRSHPEWDPILFPEKYKPKEPPEAKAVQEAGARRPPN
jgi:hypothetical protein